MRDPFLIKGPATIAFSGGRTSGYMLWRILKAHGGALPDNVLVHFANTGKEQEETLCFVHECGTRWNVPITWLEYRAAPPHFEIVAYNSASRKGEPFRQLIEKRKLLPNGVARFCTGELKIRTCKLWLKSLGWTKWDSIIGLRYDEGIRLLKGAESNASGKECWRLRWPLADAKIDKAAVMAFWREQPFDLGLQGWEGNCDGCFLKGRKTLRGTEVLRPGTLQWWADMETLARQMTSGSASQFSTKWSYSDLIAEARLQRDLFIDDDFEFDAECGLTCASHESKIDE